MNLTRFVKIQLAIFTVLAVIGMVSMAVQYMRLPTLAGVGTMRVTLQLPASGGLYRFGNVTYRGVQIGKVTSVDLNDDGVTAQMSIDGGKKIPSDLKAEVRSVSAVGEQYVELLPQVDKGPYLHDGSVIDQRRTSLPQPVGPMLDRVDSLVGSIPKDKLHQMIGEVFTGMNGAKFDLQSLLTSGATLAGDLNKNGDTLRKLLAESEPLMSSQDQSADAIRIWARSLAGVTGTIAHDDTQVRSLLDKGPGAAQEATKLLEQLKPTLPVLLSSMTTIGQIGVTYHANLEQLLILTPPQVSMIEGVQPPKNAQGLGPGDFRMSGTSDPPACTVGFLPPSQWRPPSDTTTIDTPDNMYCKLPQDSQVAVRGARNYPCEGHPGKRAATVQDCESPRGFVPLAPDQPVLGPYPHDPNLEGQGIPGDSRWRGIPPGGDPEPRTPGAASAPAAPAPPALQVPGLPPIQVPKIPGLTGPASEQTGPDTGQPGPSVAYAHYDPQTGDYMAPDGQMYQQKDLAAGDRPTSWQQLVSH